MGIKEEFQELSPAKCLVVGLLICVGYYFALFNKGDDITAQWAGIEAEMNGYKTRLQAVKTAMSDKASFESTVTSLTRDLEELLKYFPLVLDMNDIERELTDKLRMTQNQLIKISDNDTKSRFPGYNEYGVQIESQGGFHEIMNFLSAITKMNRVVDFRTINLKSVSSTDEVSMVQFKMNLSVFAQNQEKSQAPTNSNQGQGQ
ncbi:MAG: type 4a pilus biogenesis protein PilO [Bdellovibrionaceae bacterium]|nr:type 4a pilus biogenesis protein PilO [Pseudobdellovibrionaceae bacterium]